MSCDNAPVLQNFATIVTQPICAIDPRDQDRCTLLSPECGHEGTPVAMFSLFITEML